MTNPQRVEKNKCQQIHNDKFMEIESTQRNLQYVKKVLYSFSIDVV